MSCGVSDPPAPMAALQMRMRKILRAFTEETERKRAAGICVWIDCQEPAARIPRSEMFFGDDHCREHARIAEIECLEDEQSDDRT